MSVYLRQRAWIGMPREERNRQCVDSRCLQRDRCRDGAGRTDGIRAVVHLRIETERRFDAEGAGRELRDLARQLLGERIRDFTISGSTYDSEVIKPLAGLKKLEKRLHLDRDNFKVISFSF